MKTLREIKVLTFLKAAKRLSEVARLAKTQAYAHAAKEARQTLASTDISRVIEARLKRESWK